MEAHGERLKGIVKGLKRAVESPGFLKDLADTLAGIDASGCVRDTGTMLVALLRQLDGFVRGGYRVTWAPRRQGLGATYEARRDRHRLAVGAAVQIPSFLSELSEGLAGVNLFESDPDATKQLVSAASKLDAVSEGGAQQQRGAARAPKRRRRGAA